MCEECGKPTVPTIDGVCPVCKKTLCYECWIRNHRDRLHTKTKVLEEVSS